MARNIRLINQIRNVASGACQAISETGLKSDLSTLHIFLDELLYRESYAFFIDFLERGKILLTEGGSLINLIHGTKIEAGKFRDDLNSDTHFDAFKAEIQILFDYFLKIVCLLDENRSDAERAFMQRLTQWEDSLYARRIGPREISGQSQEQEARLTSEKFQEYLENRVPHWGNVRVVGFTALEGGLSKKTILVETDDALNGRQFLVIRAEQPVVLIPVEGSDITREFHMLKLMHKLGMPTAEALWLEADSDLLGTRFIVSRKVEGKIFGSTLGNDVQLPEETWDSIITTLQHMHSIKVDCREPLFHESHLNEWLPCKTIQEATRYFVEAYLPNMIRRGDVKLTPQLKRVMQWLEKNVPQTDGAPAILHVDFAYNNLLIHKNRVAAVLDWETSIVGDPAYDLVWTQENLNVCSMPQLLRKYTQDTGRAISEYRLAYAKVARRAFNMIICLNAMQILDRDDHASSQIGYVALRLMPILTSGINGLIADAERAKDIHL